MNIMIEVVKENVRCVKCGRMLAYDIEDIQEKEEKYNTYTGYDAEKVRFIKCPVCGWEIRLAKQHF